MNPWTVGPSTAAALRVAVVAALGLMGPGLSLASAQAPAPPPATLTFELDGGLVFWTIRPDKTADFESVMAKLKEALLKSEDPARKQLATGWKVYKVQEPAPQGNVFYLFLVEPAVKGADYSSAAILKILYDTYPAEAQDLYKKLTDATVGGRNVLNLQTVVTMTP